MKKIIFAFIAFFILSLPNSSFSQSDMFCQHFELRTENIDTFLDQLSIYYVDKFPPPYPTFDEARGPLREFLHNQISGSGYSTDCYPGKFWYSGYTRETVHDGINTSMYFRWNIDPAINAEHIAKLYDFMTGQESASFSTNHAEEPGIVVNSKNLNLKLLILNTSCSGVGQSKVYAMIIIDKDIHIPVVQSACVPDNPGIATDPGPGEIPVPRKAVPSKNSLKVFPNPSYDGITTLSFDLAMDQKISIQVIETSSGKIVKQLIHDQTTRAGHHTLELQNQGLKSGIHHIILQTNRESIVKKLIKM